MRKAPPMGGAGVSGGGWRWSQTDTLVRVSFPVPRGVRKADVTTNITESQLRLTLRGLPQPLLEGPLWGRINAQKALNRGHKLTKSGRVAVTLEKLDRVAWKQLFKEGVSPVAANYATLTPPPPQKWMQVAYDYDAETPHELTIRENELISVIAEDPSGWWKGQLNGAVGLFPSNFTHPYEDAPDELADDSDEEEPPPHPPLPTGGLSVSAPPQTSSAAPSNELLAKLQRRTAVMSSAPTPGTTSSGPGMQAPGPGPGMASPFGVGGRGQSVRIPRETTRSGPGALSAAEAPTPGPARPGPTGGQPLIARAQSSFGPTAGGGGGVAAAAAAFGGGGAPPPGGVSPFGAQLKSSPSGNLRSTANNPVGGGGGGGGASVSPAVAPVAESVVGDGGGSPGGSKRPPPPARSARPPLSVRDAAPVSVESSPELSSSPFGGGLRTRPAPVQAATPPPPPEPEPEPEPVPVITIEVPASDAPPGTVAMAKVMHDYQASADEELSLSTGDTIYVLVQDDSGWWQGVVNGQTGWFPANFAEEVPWTPGESAAAIQGSTDESYANDTSGDEDLTVADRLAVVESTSARLATPKRAMGASNRRRPSRSKRAPSSEPAPSLVASAIGASPTPAAAPAPAPAVAAPSNLRSKFQKPAELQATPVAVQPAEKESESTSIASKLRKKVSALTHSTSVKDLDAAPVPGLASPSSASTSGSPGLSRMPSTVGAPASPAKWPSQQLGEFNEFCANAWAMLEKESPRGGSESIGLAVCATDGTPFARGGAQRPFALGQCAFPFIQAIATNQSDSRTILAQVGCDRAPSGDGLSLNAEKKPYNGQTTAGALKLASLLYAGQDPPSRIAQLLQTFAAFAGVPYLSCSMPAYLAFRATSSKDYALAYWLKSCGGLEGDVVPALEFLFQTCAIEASCETLAMMASTLANSGSCPASRKQVVKSKVADELTSQLAGCCGMSEFNEPPDRPIALKASTSGCVLLVVPGVLGLAAFAPPESPVLAKFCKLLSSKYPSLHVKP